jgi:hypothetical protein
MAFSLAESFLGRILFRIEGKGKGENRLPILLSDDRIAREPHPPLGSVDKKDGARVLFFDAGSAPLGKVWPINGWTAVGRPAGALYLVSRTFNS